MSYKINFLSLQKKMWVNNLIVFLFCFAIIFGPAFALFDSYDYDTVANPDIGTYLGLAEFNFEQSITRKYRVIIPFLASGINYTFGGLFNILAPNTFPGPDFSMCFSFLIVNCIFMSIFGMLIYKLCKEFGASLLPAIIGLLSVLTCRWTSYLAGTPMVDSLYLIIIAATILGIKTKNSKLIILTIFIGPWAKESFIFIAPIIFFFSSINKWKQVLLFTISALIVFSFRYYLDMHSKPISGLGLDNAFNHMNNISISLKRLFSFHGVYEIISICGLWGILFIFLFKKSTRILLKQKTTFYMVIFLFVVLIHALLSVELARMFYIATPVIAIWFSLICENLISSYMAKNKNYRLV
ncbi:hypothetical protein CJ739_1522 [Mariniflexile rhizosphaerae]|uniref:hypothetical protein n=1 Tax=unclassified Mariniflexile TaxID=2643887 RepID=UPI000E330940|nr:hypothetical protein [Mariniflexile sp. TRM1-10]AXP80611.1 hypothetical protein CJ739_1522 [Mariniflexile sp. TRM1-10]